MLEEEEHGHGPPPLISAFRRRIPSMWFSTHGKSRYSHGGITEMVPQGTWAPRTAAFAGVDSSASQGALHGHGDTDIIQQQLLKAEQQRAKQIIEASTASKATATKAATSATPAKIGSSAGAKQPQPAALVRAAADTIIRAPGTYGGLTSRAAHNAMERDRRISLRDSYEALRLQVPALAHVTKASSLQILQGAARCVRRLVQEEQQLLRDIATLKRARSGTAEVICH